MREVSQVGLKQGSIGLQVVILEWLGTTDKLAVHLAQVSQVERLSQIRVVDRSQAVRWTGPLDGRLSFRFSFNPAIKAAIKTAKTAR